MRDNIPATAMRILYKASYNKGIINCWKGERGNMWHWSALGNCGQEISERLALEAARRWIRDRQ